jgi:hypothetical protein
MWPARVGVVRRCGSPGPGTYRTHWVSPELSGPSGSSPRSRRRGGSRSRGRRQLDEDVERTEAQRLADIGWVDWGGELIWAVGFTSGGAPHGLRVCDFAPADLQAMGLDVAALDDAGLLAPAESSIDESDDWIRDVLGAAEFGHRRG